MKRPRATRPKAPTLQSARTYRSLTADQLRWQCDPKTLRSLAAFKAKLPARREIIGQERALRALRVGLEMAHPGFNIFVTGLSGTGRTTTIKRMLQEFEGKKASLRDHCYVHSFKQPDMPVALSLPAGQGRGLRMDMEGLLRDLLKDIPSVYESQRYQRQRRMVVQHFQDRQKSVLQAFERRVKEEGFDLVQVQVGSMMRPEVVPVVNGSPSSLEQVEELVRKEEVTREAFAQMRDKLAELEKQMALVFRELRNIEKRLQESLGELEEKMVMPAVDSLVETVKAAYDDTKVRDYLEEVRTYVRENLDRFRQQQLQATPSNKTDEEEAEDDFREFTVNVLVDNSETKRVPIVVETNPRYKNLFGTAERELERGGVWRTDFTKIKPGALLRADGGYLVLNALDALVEPGVWQDLKRTLRTGKLDVQSGEPALGVATTGMKPEPFDISLKVIIIGDTDLYHLLWHRDDDFKKIFKIRADFDFEMPRTNDALAKYVSFVRMVGEDEKLRAFDASALAQIVEFGVRLAGSRKKISTRFNIVADVVREAHYWSGKDHAHTVTGEHVEQAIAERIYRVRLVEQKIHDLINKGVILIDTEGHALGQVNGLSVYDTGEHAFGKPSRITAKTSLGRSGVINIEREADLSGPSHTNGVAILSALSGVPIRQEIAVTGSVNQNGEVQPIGGVNEKIEGFFDTCRLRGLTGTQGVIIPIQNIDELMLREDAYTAVRRKQFHIFAVSTVDEGIEILTGVKAGRRRPDGSFEPRTINALADDRLRRYAETWRSFEGGRR